MIELVGLQLPVETCDEKAVILRVQAEVECEGRRYGVYYKFLCAKRKFFSEVEYPMEITLEYYPTMLEPEVVVKKIKLKEALKIEALLDADPQRLLRSIFCNRAYSDRMFARVVVGDFMLGGIG